MQRTNSDSLHEEALNHLVGGVNSPVRAFKSVHGNPIYFESASGAIVTDVDGNVPNDRVMKALRGEMQSPPSFWQANWKGFVPTGNDVPLVRRERTSSTEEERLKYVRKVLISNGFEEPRIIRKFNDTSFNFLPFLKNDPFYCLIAIKE